MPTGVIGEVSTWRAVGALKNKPEVSKIAELNDALDLYQLLKWAEGKSLGKVTRSP